MSQALEPSGGAGPTRILLAQDDPRAALLIGETLRMIWTDGLVLAQVERLSDAIHELLERGASCVLLDLSLPGIDLTGSIEQVANAAPEVPIIVLAEQDDEQAALAAIRAGAQDYLIKSRVHPSLLRQALHYAIERKRSEVRLARLALHDTLTGLPNRALFLDRLGVALDRSRRTGSSIAVLFLDVDNFKQVNDTLGHAAGDRLLVGLAERLRTMLRPMDTVARFGGDEFTFLFEELAGEREVVLIAERIARACAMPLDLLGAESSTTCSIGIAIVSDPSIPPETVIRDADAAMYRAKELGGSRYELFDESSRSRALERLQLETELGHAIERAELRIHYQPRISLAAGAGVAGLEALVRWQHPERGLIRPDAFIPIAEETGLVVSIGHYVLQQALMQVARWRRSKPDVTVSVNLSFRQLEDPGLAPALMSAIGASGITPAALCLEISERAITRNPELAQRALQALKATGVKIAIDDYGTGPSSLASLRSLPVDTLKIHESFVEGLDRPHEASLVGALVKLGHDLGLDVVAEGVETTTQLEELRMLGCDGAQGFLLGHPVPEDQVEALLN